MSYFAEANFFLRMLQKGEMNRQKAQNRIQKILAIAARIELTMGMPAGDSPSTLALELQDSYYDALADELAKANARAETPPARSPQRPPIGKVSRWLHCPQGHETFGPKTMRQIPCSACGTLLFVQ